MNSGLTRWLLKCFPASWRAEYGSELEDLLLRRSLGLRDVADVLLSACREQLRRSMTRFYFALLAASGSLFTLGLLLSGGIWQAVNSPVNTVLRNHGIRPSALVSVTPWEGWEVIWLGLPLLFTIFALYPCFLWLASIFVTPAWDNRIRRRANMFALSSGTVFVLSLSIGFVLWRQGVPLGLLLDRALTGPNAPVHPLVSVGDYFILLAWSALGWAVIWQVPVLLFFAWLGSSTEVSDAK